MSLRSTGAVNEPVHQQVKALGPDTDTDQTIDNWRKELYGDLRNASGSAFCENNEFASPSFTQQLAETCVGRVAVTRFIPARGDVMDREKYSHVTVIRLCGSQRTRRSILPKGRLCL